MMKQVSKNSGTSLPTINNQAPNHDKPASKTAEQKTQQPTEEPQNFTSVTSYSSLLKEAYDGDNEEANTLALNGAKIDNLKEGSNTRNVIEKNSNGASSDQQDTENNTSSDEEFIQKLRNSKRPHAITSSETHLEPNTSSTEVKAAHNQLILASSQLKIDEISTHISFQPFLALSKILQDPLWMRQINCDDLLIQAQMEASGQYKA